MRTILAALMMIPAVSASALSNYGTIDLNYKGQASGLSAANGGRFNWDYSNLNSSFDESLFLTTYTDGDAAKDIYSFCLEIGETIPSGTHTYTLRDVTDAPLNAPGTGFGTGQTMTDAQASAVELLAEHYLVKAATGALSLTDSSNIALTTAQVAGAFQLAVWETLYGDGNAANGGLGGTDLDNNSKIRDGAQKLLNSLASLQDLPGIKAIALTIDLAGTSGQDQLIVIAVPEAASLLAWASVVGAVGLIAYRRGRVAA